MSLKVEHMPSRRWRRKSFNTASQNVTNAKTNVDKSSKKAIDNITGVTNAIARLGEADVSLSSFGDSVGSLVDVLSESGSKIGGIIAAIPAILDQIGDRGLTNSWEIYRKP